MKADCPAVVALLSGTLLALGSPSAVRAEIRHGANRSTATSPAPAPPADSGGETSVQGSAEASDAPADTSVAPAANASPPSGTATPDTGAETSKSSADAAVPETPAETPRPEDGASAAPEDPVAGGDDGTGADARADAPGDGDDGDDGDEDATTEDGSARARPEKTRSHHKAFGISLAPGFGYAMILAGDKFCGSFSSSNDDSDGRSPVCATLLPAYLDIAFSYGVGKKVDLVFGARVNLQRRTFDDSDCPAGDEFCPDGRGLFNDSLGAGFFPGVRIWGKGVERIVKLGVGIDMMVLFENFDGYRSRPRSPREEPQGSAAYDVSVASEAAVGDVSLGLRAGPVLSIDPHHNFGFYIFPAVAPSFRPAKRRDVDAGWLEIAVDFSAGVQARFP